MTLLAAWLCMASAVGAVNDNGTRTDSVQHESWHVNDQGWLTFRTENGPVFGGDAQTPLDVRLGDNTWLLHEAGHTHPVVMITEEGGFSVVHEMKDGIVTDHYTPFPTLGNHAWLRRVRYQNTSKERQDLTGVRMFVAPLATAATTWTPRQFYMTRVVGHRIAAVAYRGSTDLYRFHLQGAAVGHEVEAGWRLEPGDTAHIEAQAIWVRTIKEEVSQEERYWQARFRDEARRWYDAIDLHVPEGMPDWVRTMVLYEYNAGGHIDSRFSDVGGFDRLAEQTPYLAELGVSAVWLQAVHQHKTPPNPIEGGWNPYGPRDFDVVEPFMGGDGALRALCDGLRDVGIRVLGGVVPHGGHSIQAEALSECWSYERDGAARRNWGGFGMDYASPAWQAVLSASMAHQARTFGFEGCRVDVADGSGPNWNSPRTRHASYSTLGGAVELLEALRDGMTESLSYPVLIPESFDQVEYFRITPIGYGHDFWMFIHNQIEPVMGAPATMATLFRAYLETERGALPCGALRLRTLNNHDTVCEAGRVHRRFGAGLARALHGLCLMIPGIPMLYQEQEIGDYYALRALHRARAAIPEFTNTDVVDYFALTYAPEVFACLRGDDETGYALGLTNLSGAMVDDRVHVADYVAFPDGVVVFDGVSGRQSTMTNNTFPWRLGPYETALLRVGQPAHDAPTPLFERTEEPATPQAPRLLLEDDALYFTCGAMRAELHAGAAPWMLGADDGEGQTYMSGALELRVTETAQGLQCILTFGHSATEDWPALSITDAAQWMVSGQTALLHDQVLRRHYPWPETIPYVWDKTMFWGPHPGHLTYNRMAPTGRLWESVIEPLHPEAPGLLFQDADNHQLLIHTMDSDVHNIVLRDGADIRPGEDAYGLRAEFRGHDATLAPTVHEDILGIPFHVAGQKKDARAVYTAAFVLTVVEDGESTIERRLRETSRTHSNRHQYQMQLDGDDVHRSPPLGIVFPEPGQVVWSGLPLPAGAYRIEFRMRHSEVAPQGTDLDDAYTIRVNEKEIAYTWTERNVLQHGNAYFGTVLTEAVTLDGDACTVAAATTRPWCMMSERFILHPVENH